MKVAITGASGGIGRALVRGLSREGFAVRGLVRSPAACQDPEWVRGDIRDPDAVRRMSQGADLIVHVAGMAHRPACGRPDLMRLFHDVNVKGTENVCRVAVDAGVRAVVLMSSAAVYGRSLRAGPAAETAVCLPDSAYGASKLAAEQAAQELTRGSSTRLVVLRLATVYGPGTRGNITRLMRMARRGVIIAVAPGTARKSLLFIEDLVRVCVTLAATDSRAETLNVASSRGYAVREIVSAIRQHSPRRVREIWLSPLLMLTVARGNERAARALGVPCVIDRDGVRALTEDSVIDTSRLQERVGALASMTALEAGVSRTLAGELAGHSVKGNR